ncbi:MAG: F0F1 ATP synthase subunit epsilon [Burkholderiales bacterium]|jgi:F-type H+-transporting ATPase subunit epsilon
MKTFMLKLQDATREEEIGAVTSFVAEDASGSFGILAGHARMMTTLSLGLARFRIGESDWRYLAVTESVLYFCDNTLTLATHRYLMGDDYTLISRALQEQLLAEEEMLHDVRQSLHQLEEELFKRLWETGRRAAR